MSKAYDATFVTFGYYVKRLSEWDSENDYSDEIFNYKIAEFVNTVCRLTTEDKQRESIEILLERSNNSDINKTKREVAYYALQDISEALPIFSEKIRAELKFQIDKNSAQEQDQEQEQDAYAADYYSESGSSSSSDSEDLNDPKLGIANLSFSYQDPLGLNEKNSQKNSLGDLPQNPQPQTHQAASEPLSGKNQKMTTKL